MSIPLPRQGECELLNIHKNDLDISHLEVHVLEEHSRQSLIIDRQPWAYPQNISAETVLERLAELDPSVAEAFTPKSKALNGLIFRLVNDSDRLQDESSYIAMSYCSFGWVRTVEQFPLPTTPAMFEAVLRQRESEYEGLWFDQVCINQDDEAEKAVSIGAMDTIYKNARAVVIALDDIEADTHEVDFLWDYINAYSAEELSNLQPNWGQRPPYMQTHSAFKSFFERILSSTWFERAWCGHEMRLGSSHVFLVPCSSSSSDSYTFIRFTGAFFHHMLTLSSEVISSTPGHQIRKTTLQQLFGRRTLISEREALVAQNPGVNFPPLPDPFIYVIMIADVFHMKAGGNPRLPDHLRVLDANRDKISIVLNTSGHPLALKPYTDRQPPSIEDECLRQLLIIGLATRDPVALCTTGPPIQRYNGQISWLRRPSPLDIVSAGSSLPRFPSMETSISLGFGPTSEYIQLDLIFLGFSRQQRADSALIWQRHFRCASEFTDQCIQQRIESYTMWSSWQSIGHPRADSMKNVFAQTLACCFECGPTWTYEISKRFQIGSYGLTPEAVSQLFDPSIPFGNHISTHDGRQNITFLVNFLSTLVAYGIPWASGATEMTCGPIPVSIRTGEVAVVFAPFEMSHTIKVAVPDAVKATQYDSLSRAWLVTEMREDAKASEWILQAKSLLFGDSSFTHALSLQVGRTQRVFGPTDS
ncbi:hypothetical protein AOQ84DRAFT_312653 [Glonium stellatum]|uniref:Heterokaryon incompatibility domain-containing protein n=1 Tax=Glonium stellatum TaxID=574774 RepID=A0A8E2JWG8_9PEZI|nr:hypothetical protein AOQ84DRAFT_312653 [Glonium stellatum]